ncbi:MbnP family protein [Sabulibacter ruber]|uniref:MbnP family protein n=1 Tax=Sabulibacter ruber TaxID=2811901 RepID=UPI001A9799B7|nr:MbnP family protein [Sabulibacter ruber]
MKSRFTFGKNLSAAFLLVLALFSWSCSDDDESTVAEPSQVTLAFQHTFNTQPFALEQEYTNAHGHRVKFHAFRYYISNVKLTRPDGTTYEEPNSYHLIERTADHTQESFTLPDVPAGTYTTLTFSVGVDPASNHSTDQVGDLDPNQNMAWDWDTGYKFLVAEGQYFNTSEGAFKNFLYHIGHDANYRTITLALPSNWGLTGENRTLDLLTNSRTLFGGPNVIDLSATGFSSVMGGANAALVADNIRQMFQLK